MKGKRSESGFTLPELLAAGAVLLVLIAVSFIFVHPRDYSLQNRDAERYLGVAQLSQVIARYKADNGQMPAGLIDKPLAIGNDSEGLDWCALLVPKYMADVPLDPTAGYQVSLDTCLPVGDTPSVYQTGYTIQQHRDGTVTIAAPSAEGKQPIEITRRY